MDWKEVLKFDIDTKIREADVEYRKYKKNPDSNVIYLQQAGEKIFSAVENYLKIKYGVKTSGFNELTYLVLANEKDTDLLNTAAQLHYFFYDGRAGRLQPETIDGLYNSVRDRLKARLR